MKILFVHQSFPAQFRHLGPTLAKDASNEVIALTMQSVVSSTWHGIRTVTSTPSRGRTPAIHPWAAEFESQLIRGETTMRTALNLRDSGFSPDIIIAHPGWGESLFLKQVWPKAKLGIYCEFFYQVEGADIGFDNEFVSDNIDARCRIQTKNANNLMHLEIADLGISPTHWQASTFPARFQSKISVIHDGIDTDIVAPNQDVAITLNDALELTRDNEVITFVNRNLEPYRGYHIFMRALPNILKRRPNAHVLIVGGDSVSYGAAPSNGKKWKDIFWDEVKDQMSHAESSRVHFLGNLPYEYFIPLLQLSRVHVYLTYPFVLSWSLLEAMSVGCAIVASDTQPLKEAIQHDETGRLFDFFDIDGLTNEVCALLEDPDARERLGRNARQFAQKHYDLKTVCLPQQLRWVESLSNAKT